MNNPIIRVGIIGGSANNQWAGTAHIPALQQLPEYKITAIGTTRMETAETSARHFGVPHAFVDSSELAQHPEVGLVVVSVKVPGHYEAVMAALEAGKHIYCEWPLGLSTSQAIEMSHLAKAKKVHHAVGLQARQSPEVHYMKDLVLGGYVGQVLSCHMKVFTSAKDGTINQRYNYLLDESNGANLLTINTGHAVDALCYILGDFNELSASTANQIRQAKVEETGEIIQKTTADQVLINGILQSGAAVSVHVQGGLTHRTGVSLEIYGTEGVLVFSKESAHAQLQFGGLTLEGAQLASPENASLLKKLLIPKRYRRVSDTIPDGPVLNVAQAYALFAEDIRTGNHRIANFEDGVNLHRLLDRIQQAASTGQRQVF